jgi:hypothetical protein
MIFALSMVDLKTLFLSFLRPSSATDSAKSSRMIAHYFVDEDFSGVSAKSTQIGTPADRGAQMAASLALFFWLPSVSTWLTFPDLSIYVVGCWVPDVFLSTQ